MADECFSLLGLAVQPTDSETLLRAYQVARQVWFFRQFEPEYLLEAREKLEKIDEAYRSLKDPRRQSAVIRQIKAKTRSAANPGVAIAEPAVPPRPEPPAKPLANRPLLARQLLRHAEEIVARTGETLSTADIKQMRETAVLAGLSHADAEELVERVARQAELIVRPLSLQPRGERTSG